MSKIKTYCYIISKNLIQTDKLKILVKNMSKDNNNISISINTSYLQQESDPENNNRITRSAVYIGRDKAIIGDKAVDAAVTNRNSTILEVKSQMENNVIWSKKEGDWLEKTKKDTKGYENNQKGGWCFCIPGKII